MGVDAFSNVYAQLFVVEMSDEEPLLHRLQALGGQVPRAGAGVFQGRRQRMRAKPQVRQATVKNLYRRITYRLMDDFELFSFHRELLTDCFETGGRRVETLKRCLWQCPGDKGYGDLPDRDICAECPFAAEFRDSMQNDHAALAMYFARRSLAPLTSFSFVNRAAYIFGQQRFLYGPLKNAAARRGVYCRTSKQAAGFKGIEGADRGSIREPQRRPAPLVCRRMAMHTTCPTTT